jgi:uncharacterized MnhB-related membrane protein
MIARILEGAADWIALALMLGVIAAALGAASARSLYAMSMYLTAAGALAAAALLAHGAGDAALAQALVGIGLAPFLVLAALLLSSRAAKPRRGGRPWLSIVAACAVAGAVLWTLPDLGAPAPARIALVADHPLAPWLAPLLLVLAAACVGLLGYGERGALERGQERL